MIASLPSLDPHHLFTPQEQSSPPRAATGTTGAHDGSEASSPPGSEPSDAESTASPPRRGRRGQGAPKPRSSWEKAAWEVRDRVRALDAQSDKDLLALPRGYGIAGCKWSVADMGKRLAVLKKLVHPDAHVDAEIDANLEWLRVWNEVQAAYVRLVAAARAGGADAPNMTDNPDDPVAAAMEWELPGSVPRESYHASVTWVPVLRRGQKIKKGKLPDSIRMQCVKAAIAKIEAHVDAARAAELLPEPPNSIAMYAERGKNMMGIHLQGYVFWRSNGGPDVAICSLKAFLDACFPLHSEVRLWRVGVALLAVPPRAS